MKLAGTRIENEARVPNELGWLKPGVVQFEVRFAYRLEANWNDEDIWKEWRLIWKLKVHQKVKECLWLMTHDRLLTNFARWHRGLS